MGFAVVAVVDGFNRGDAGHTGGDQRLRQFGDLHLRTQQGTALQYVAPRQQRSAEQFAGQGFEQQAAKQRRRFELTVMAPDHPPVRRTPDPAGLPDKTLPQPRHRRTGGDL